MQDIVTISSRSAIVDDKTTARIVARREDVTAEVRSEENEDVPTFIGVEETKRASEGEVCFFLSCCLTRMFVIGRETDNV